MEERKVPDIMFLGNESKFSNKLMKLDSDLINIANNSRRQNSASRPKEEEKMYKDSQINHSKLIRIRNFIESEVKMFYIKSKS